jgi:hypothetical protein
MRFGFIASFIIAILAIVDVFIPIPIVSQYAFWVVVAAYIVLAGSRVGDTEPKRNSQNRNFSQDAYALIGKYDFLNLRDNRDVCTELKTEIVGTPTCEGSFGKMI